MSAKESVACENDWYVISKMLPVDWKELARSTSAVTRNPRGFDGEEGVLKALLLHIAGGYSLRETAARLKLTKAANVSDVALLKRLRSSEQWFKELCLRFLHERGISIHACTSKIRMRIVDATTVKEPGKTGSLWRIHYSLLLPDLQCDYFKITETTGKGSGESFRQFPVQKGDCIVGYRGYSTAKGIIYLASKKAYALVRVNTGSLKFFTPSLNALDVLSEARQISQEHEAKECDATVISNGEIVYGRLCIVRKSQTATDLAVKKLRAQASKKQKKLDPTTLEFAKYVILFTTLPKDLFSLEEILKWYRVRWQIELAFKRLKSVAGLGHLPKHDEISARAWLYGKIFTGLLVEKLVFFAKSFSPWGYA